MVILVLTSVQIENDQNALTPYHSKIASAKLSINAKHSQPQPELRYIPQMISCDRSTHS